MSVNEGIRRLLEKLTRSRMYRNLPRGIDPLYDIKTHLPRLPVKVVFDVGANIGQSAKSFREAFSESTIYCFEPVKKTFLALQINLQGDDRIQSFQLALGTGKGRGKMVLEGIPQMFFLRNASPEQVSGSQPTEEVVLETLDGFCRAQHIDRINLLKVDTEGGDLDVLKGAVDMLDRQQIDVVQVEAGMNGRNRRHVPFDAFMKFFEERNYFLFGVYEQKNEWQTQEPHLRRTNPIFISDTVIKANCGCEGAG